MSKPLVNRVAKSGIITLDLENYYPENEIVVFDIKDYLFKGLILKESTFREVVDAYAWNALDGKHLVVTCTADAIVPRWAYMLVAAHAGDHAITVSAGDVEQFLTQFMSSAFDSDWDLESFRDARVVLKGCSDRTVPPGVYLHVTAKLKPLVKSIMYGEPCSTVPIYKAPRVPAN